MKTAVIKFSWLAQTSNRLDTPPYLSGALQVRDRLRALKLRKNRLDELTTGPEGGIFNGPKFVRNYLDSPEHGVPFMTGSSMLLADGTRLPLLRKKDAQSSVLRHLELKPGMSLISCSGTIGKMAYVRDTMKGVWASQDVLKVVPDPTRIPSGYLYAFLCSRFGVPLIAAGTYGSVIQHLEPHHLAPLEVPRLKDSKEREIHALIETAAGLLSDYSREIVSATDRFFKSVGLHDTTTVEWNSHRERDIGFKVKFPNPFSMRALNFTPRANDLWKKLVSVRHKGLAEICSGGVLSRGSRFKRIAADEEFGARMIGQKELFTLKPVGQWLARNSLPLDAFAADGTIAVAARGTLGESELYCRCEFVTGPWTKFAYTEDILKITADSTVMPRGCLFAFLRSETAFHILRAISSGSKLQENHYYFLPRFPVPMPSRREMEAIDAIVVGAYRKRHDAVALENRAVTLVEAAIDAS